MGVTANVLGMADTTRTAIWGLSKTANLDLVKQRAEFWPSIRAQLPYSADGKVALVP